MYRVKIISKFLFGAYDLSFEKVFILSFVPFYNLYMFDGKEDEIDLNFLNKENHKTEIHYSYNDNTNIDFHVYLREIWREPVVEEAVDDILKKYRKNDWERLDTTDEEELKVLMRTIYNKNLLKNNL